MTAIGGLEKRRVSAQGSLGPLAPCSRSLHLLKSAEKRVLDSLTRADTEPIRISGTSGLLSTNVHNYI